MGRPPDRADDAPEDENGAIDRAEDSFALDEIDEILADTNEKTDDDEAGKVTDDGVKKRADDAAAAEYFGDPISGRLGDIMRPADSENMMPDPKSDSYYAGGFGIAPPPATLMLEKIRISLKTHVSPAVLSQMKFNSKYDPVTDKIMMEIGMYLFSNKIHTETTKKDYPAGWFQGFKDAHFPGWLKNKFPVKYTQIFEEVKTIHICPHLNYRTRDDERFHLQFLMPEGDLTRAQS